MLLSSVAVRGAKKCSAAQVDNLTQSCPGPEQGRSFPRISPVECTLPSTRCPHLTGLPSAPHRTAVHALSAPRLVCDNPPGPSDAPSALFPRWHLVPRTSAHTSDLKRCAKVWPPTALRVRRVPLIKHPLCALQRPLRFLLRTLPASQLWDCRGPWKPGGADRKTASLVPQASRAHTRWELRG